MRQLAYEEASAQYERALQALQLRHGGPADGVGDALARAEFAPHARPCAAPQRDTGGVATDVPARRRGGSRRDGHTARRRGRSPARRRGPRLRQRQRDGNVVEGSRHAARALGALRDAEHLLRARLLARQAMALYFSPDSARGEAVRLEALELARAPATSPPSCAASWRGILRSGDPTTSKARARGGAEHPSRRPGT